MTFLEVTAVAGLATVQDAGRPGRMHEGIPPGGALVPELLARANLAAGNEAGAAGLELVGSIGLVARGGAVTIATEDDVTRVLEEGETHRIDGRPGARVRYVAVRGGVDVPVVLGGRGTLLVAGIGGFDGRGVKRGDLLQVGRGGGASASAVAVAGSGSGEREGEGAIRVCAGPDLERFGAGALDALRSGEFAISPRSDRTGTRLVGPRIARAGEDDGVSSPMVAGAIEVPAAGDPIVLGPDHPTTGGYPVLAVILRADLGRFHRRSIGSVVRFV